MPSALEPHQYTLGVELYAERAVELYAVYSEPCGYGNDQALDKRYDHSHEL